MEKERELELQEKLEEQRRVLEGEQEAALQGKDVDAALGRMWEGPPSGPICQVHGGVGAHMGPALRPLVHEQLIGCFRAGILGVLGLVFWGIA